MKKVLYIFIFVLTLLAVLCFSASAVDTVYEDANSINWKVTLTDFSTPLKYGDTTADGSAIINGIDETEYTQVGFEMPSFVTYEGKTYVVTEIKNSAFKSGNGFSSNLVFGNVTFPKYLTKIGQEAFHRTRIYGDIVIPDSVTSIGSSAFYECRGILTVKLPASITDIASNTFNGCYSLTKVEAPSNIAHFRSQCFYNCYALQSVPLGPGTITVETKAFINCKALTSVDLSTVSTMSNDNVFYGCLTLETVILSSTQAYDEDVFGNCPQLKEYKISEGASSLKTVDGVLYDKNMTILYHYPPKKDGTSYVIPDSVTTIQKGAFYNATDLTSILLTDNVQSIGDNAFRNTSVVTFLIPDSVKTFGTYVLADCPYLEWVVIGSQIKSASNVVSNSKNVTIVYGRNESFATTGTGVSSAGKAYSSATPCPKHLYGYSDQSPTCTESGLNICIACNDAIYARPLGHTGPIIEESALSCTTDEYVVIDCIVCGEKAKTVYKTASGHTPENQPIIHTAQNINLSYKVVSCTTCNEIIVYDYVASPYLVGDINNDKEINAKDVTYLGKYLGGQTLTVNKLAADLNKDNKIDTADLLLLKRFVEKIDNEISKSDSYCQRHLRVETKVHEQNQSDTCTHFTIYVSYCLDCGMLINTSIDKAEGHSWTYVRGFESTCTYQGFARYECSVCKKYYEETFPLADHTGSWWTMPDMKGYEYRNCENCDLFQSREVDYSEFDALIAQLSPNYEKYYSQKTLDLLNPIINNYKNSVLTQELVDQNVDLLRSYIPRIEYKVTDVPAIYITTDGTSLTKRMDYIWAELAVAYFDENGNYVDIVDTNGLMRLRGNSTASGGNSSKHPYNIKFTTDIDLFGLGKNNKYCLLANGYDPAFIRNGVARELNKMILSDYTCDYEFVEVYYNGNYRGAYMLCTPVDIEEDIINLDKNDEFILEIEYNSGDVVDNTALYIQTPYTNFRVKIDSHDVEDITSDGYAAMYSILMQADFALMSGDWEQVQKYFDIENLAKYYILHEYFKDVDYAWDSTRFCIDDGKITAGPAWDFDRAMGHANKSGGNADCRDAYWNSSKKPSIGGIEGDSTTGTWANVIYNGIPTEQWINDPTNTSNNSSQNWDRQNGNHNWFTFLYLYYPEFVEVVSDYIWELQDELAYFYTDTYDEIGNRTVNYIDKIYNDEALYNLIINNYKIHMNGQYLYSPEGFSFKSWAEALAHLREWLQGRHEWMLEFYCGERYAVQNADEILYNKDTNAYYKSTTTRSYELGGVLIYEVRISSIKASEVDMHIAEIYELINAEFDFVDNYQIEFYYNVGSTTMTYINGVFTM